MCPSLIISFLPLSQFACLSLSLSLLPYAIPVFSVSNRCHIWPERSPECIAPPTQSTPQQLYTHSRYSSNFTYPDLTESKVEQEDIFFIFSGEHIKSSHRRSTIRMFSDHLVSRSLSAPRFSLQALLPIASLCSGLDGAFNYSRLSASRPCAPQPRYSDALGRCAGHVISFWLQWLGWLSA